MTPLQVISVLVVTLTGTVVVVIGDPLRQALMLGVFGMSLTILFFVFQAPDVALSEIVVSALALPLIVLAALRKLREQEHAACADREPENKR